jgi:hypothetical protein
MIISFFIKTLNVVYLITISKSISISHNDLFFEYSSVFHSESHTECSCQTLPHPKTNRTTRCLQLRVGLTEILENVFCQNDDSSQWLTIQNRQTNSIDFNRTWFTYRRGFGNILNQTDFWIGNENLHWLTINYLCRLKIELTDWYNETRTAIYETFRIANQQDGYRIHINGYHGDIEPTNKIDSKIKENDLIMEVFFK